MVLSLCRLLLRLHQLHQPLRGQLAQSFVALSSEVQSIIPDLLPLVRRHRMIRDHRVEIKHEDVFPLVVLDALVQLVPHRRETRRLVRALGDRENEDLGAVSERGVGDADESFVDRLGVLAPADVVGAAEEEYPVEFPRTAGFEFI